jgi:hypothetical protein
VLSLFWSGCLWLPASVSQFLFACSIQAVYSTIIQILVPLGEPSLSRPKYDQVTLCASSCPLTRHEVISITYLHSCS